MCSWTVKNVSGCCICCQIYPHWTASRLKSSTANNKRWRQSLGSQNNIAGKVFNVSVFVYENSCWSTASSIESVPDYLKLSVVEEMESVLNKFAKINSLLLLEDYKLVIVINKRLVAIANKLCRLCCLCLVYLHVHCWKTKLLILLFYFVCNCPFCGT